MTEEQKQNAVEKMARIMGKCGYYKTCVECMAVSKRMIGDDRCDLIENATALIEANYRPEAEVRAEAAKEYAENEAKIETLRNKTFQEMENTINRLEKLLDDKCGRCIANEREKVAREFAAKTQEALKFYKSHCGGESIYYAMREEINDIEKEYKKEDKRWNVQIAEVKK